MKKYVIFLLTAAILLSASCPVFAASVVRTSQSLTVDGRAVACDIYNIDGNNYFKLRDLAYLLNGTGSQFSVGYNEAARSIAVTTRAAYLPVGGELKIGPDRSGTAKASTQTLYIDGVLYSTISAYNIGGNNFFKLRDLGTVLGFDVSYDNSTRTMCVKSTGTTFASADIWERRFYVDTFNLPTENWYITNKDFFEGTFSDSATRDSKLYAAVNVDPYGFDIVLYKYGSVQVENFSTANPEVYSITVRSSDGTDYAILGRMYPGSHRILIDEAYTYDILSAFAAGGRVGFYLEHTIAGITSSYLFWAECGDFAEEYLTALGVN